MDPSSVKLAYLVWKTQRDKMEEKQSSSLKQKHVFEVESGQVVHLKSERALFLSLN